MRSMARIDAPLSDLGKDALDPLLWLVLAGGSLRLGETRDRGRCCGSAA